MSLNQGQVLKDRYRIVKLLGKGGFGVIYRAWDINLNRICALKENLDISPEAYKQFRREAGFLANLIHPNLVRVTDHFFIPGQGQYLVMDYIEGEDLMQILDRTKRPLPEAQVLNWISQICEALAYLHSQNPPVVHRDIKPANIRITPQGRAVLVDFGIAKIYDQNLPTTIGARAVSPGFSPPEQYGKGKTNPQSDIYSLAATIYELLTCQTPPESVEILAGNELPPKPVHLLNPNITKRVSDAIDHAMKLDRKDRFNNILEFEIALGILPATNSIHKSRTTSLKLLWVLFGSLGVVLILVLLILEFNIRVVLPPHITATTTVVVTRVSPQSFNSFFLGQDGASYAGKVCSKGSVPDNVHIHLEGLIVGVSPTTFLLKDPTGGVWATPCNPVSNWLLYVVYPSSGQADLYFKPYREATAGTLYTIKISYDDGTLKRLQWLVIT
jgi:serine/threonine-protein kinase